MIYHLAKNHAEILISKYNLKNSLKISYAHTAEIELKRINCDKKIKKIKKN